MAYSTDKITTVADCDLILVWAAKEKADLNFKILSEERLTKSYSTAVVEIDAELQAVVAEITATETIIAALPEGKNKDDSVKKKVRLEYKKNCSKTEKKSLALLPYSKKYST